MAKTIKFNMILDGYPVRNLEELQEHFSIEDVLKYYKSGLLLRWLNVRGYADECKLVSTIGQNEDDKSIIKKLILIFKIEMLDSVIEHDIAILDFRMEELERLDRYQKGLCSHLKIIDDYHNGYISLIYKMQNDGENLAQLKADAEEMEKEYSRLFRIDNARLYKQLRDSAPKAIFALLTRELFRSFWLDETSEVYEWILREIQPRVREIMGEDAKSIMRDTSSMFIDVVPPKVKVMVLYLSSGAFIRSQMEEDIQQQLGANDVTGKFLILEGLRYQGPAPVKELLYMEV